MPLTPLDIHNKEFRRVLRGYSEEEVDEFLDQVVRDFEALLRENAGLKEELAAMSDRVNQYRQMEDTLHNTLIVAQETAEEVKNNARKEAELIVREAEEEGRRIVAEGQAHLRAIQREAENLRRQVATFRARVKSLLEGQLEWLDRAWEDMQELPRSAAATAESDDGGKREAEPDLDAPTLRIPSSGE